MLNSVQQYVKGILQGLETPLTNPLVSVVMPPVLADAADGPTAYVWGTRLTGARQTSPRPFGQMKLVWDCSVALTEAFDQDDPNVEQAFPLVIDQIQALMMTTPLQQKGVYLVDPTTGNKTQLVAIGERFSFEYTAVTTTSGPGVGLLVFACDITFVAEELVSFNPGSYYNELFNLGDVE